MGGQQIDCPLCCDKTFDSKLALVEHLSNILNNIFCPLCKSKWTSIEGLTEHLTDFNCLALQNEPVQNIVIYDQGVKVHNEHSTIVAKSLDIVSAQPELSTTDPQYITDETYESQDDTNEVNNMYVELLGKELSKPVIRTQELKLINEDGEHRYVLVTQDDEMKVHENDAIVTKQNNDGTLSLTTVNDMKLEMDTLIVSEPAPQDKETELYSCNTCGVSFTSVLEHIQNYHNDQEVVLEEADEDTALTDKLAARRVITDTGNIVEEPMVFKNEKIGENEEGYATAPEPELEFDKHGHTYTNRLVQNDTITETVSSEPAPAKPVPEKTDYHKVIKKQVFTKTGLTVKMYNCMICNVTVSDLNEFESHPCRTFKYPCPECSLGFETSKSFSAHMKVHKDKPVKYPCPQCPVGYETSKSLSAHMKVHKERPDGTALVVLPPTYVCGVCNTVFKTNKSLKLHKRMHDPIKSRPIEPPVENFDGKDVTGELYLCTTCNKVIPLDYQSVHEDSHYSSNKMNCSICNKKFTSKEFMDMHMNIHNLDKAPMNRQDKSLPYKCLYCNRRFARPHEKVKHERIHTGEKPHSCEICGKSFRVLYCLTLHMRTHTGARPYECPHCGKRFKAHSVYSHHLQTHSEVRAYKCPFCPKAFKTSVQLAGHKNSHTKPFSCQQCNRPFASLYAVRVHTETHNRQNNLKFSCAMCGASYARAFALKDHVKQVHNKDMDSAENVVENSPDDNDDWMIARDPPTDPDGIPSPSNDLQETMTDLEMTANELIAP